MTIFVAHSGCAIDGRLEGTILRVGCVMTGTVKAGQQLNAAGENPILIVQQLQDKYGFLDTMPGSVGNYLVEKIT